MSTPAEHLYESVIPTINQPGGGDEPYGAAQWARWARLLVAEVERLNAARMTDPCPHCGVLTIWPEHPERAPAPELIRGEAPPSRSYPDAAAALTPTLAAPTGAAAPTCPECGCAMEAVGPTRQNSFWCIQPSCPEHRVWHHPLPAGRAPAELGTWGCGNCGAAGEAESKGGATRQHAMISPSCSLFPWFVGRAPARAGTTPACECGHASSTHNSDDACIVLRCECRKFTLAHPLVPPDWQSTLDFWQRAAADAEAENASLRAEVSRLSAVRAEGTTTERDVDAEFSMWWNAHAPLLIPLGAEHAARAAYRWRAGGSDA